MKRKITLFLIDAKVEESCSGCAFESVIARGPCTMGALCGDHIFMAGEEDVKRPVRGDPSGRDIAADFRREHTLLPHLYDDLKVPDYLKRQAE